MKLNSLLMILLCLLHSSCDFGEANARKRCYLSQIGIYKFDTLKNNISEFKDIPHLDSFYIVFKPDSSFYMNRKVPFFTDTFGIWDAGTCGFENSGLLRYKNFPVEEQFGSCHQGDSFFTIQSPYKEHEQSYFLWFKKIKNGEVGR